jgi:hypothetical protein
LPKVLKNKEKGQEIRKSLVSCLGKKTSFAEAPKLITIKVKSTRGKRLAEDKQYVLMQWTTNS